MQKQSASALGKDGLISRSEPIPILRRATRDSKAPDDELPPSPTASISGDKYILVRAPKPPVVPTVSTLCGGGNAVVKAIAATVDQKSDLCTSDGDTKVSLSGNRGTLSSRATTLLRKGMKEMETIVPFSFSLNCAVSGISTSVLSVLADANSAEFGAFLLLYDEYRVRGGRVEYFLPCLSPAGGSAGVSQDSMHVMVYDSVDTTALTSVRNGCEYEQHKLIAPAPVLGTATSSATMKWGFSNTTGKPFVFEFTTPQAGSMAISGGGSVTQSAGQWKSLNNVASNNPDGCIKVYNVSDYSTAATTCTGVVHLDIQFRRRK